MPNGQQNSLDFMAKLKRGDSILPPIILDEVKTGTLSLLYEALSIAGAQIDDAKSHVVKEITGRREKLKRDLVYDTASRPAGGGARGIPYS